MNTLDLAQQRVQLRKASQTAGGEWQGPCPGCGGTDRFHVWPAQYEGKGAYWCRGCGKWGDNIQFLREFSGLSYKEACARLHIDPRAAQSDVHHLSAPVPRREKPQFVPATPAAPADIWQEKAGKFISWAADSLGQNGVQLAWLSARGISADTAARFRLGWNPGEDGKDIYRPRKAWGLEEILKDDGRPKALWIPRGLVIPCVAGGVIQRVRIRRPEGEPRYYVIPGSSMATMVVNPERRAFVIVESELDGIAVAAGNTLAGAVPLGSVAAKPDAAAFAILRDAVQILNALDYDAAGARAMAWWAENFRNHVRWPVPKGKDPGEAIKLGMAVEQWILAGLPPALTIAGKGEGRLPGVQGNGPVPERRESSPPPALPEEPGGPLLPASILELRDLLRKNPQVRIINTPTRYTVQRAGRYVGGRIGELVFRHAEVVDYLSGHPDQEIHAGNLIKP